MVMGHSWRKPCNPHGFLFDIPFLFTKHLAFRPVNQLIIKHMDPERRWLGKFSISKFSDVAELCAGMQSFPVNFLPSNRRWDLLTLRAAGCLCWCDIGLDKGKASCPELFGTAYGNVTTAD